MAEALGYLGGALAVVAGFVAGRQVPGRAEVLVAAFTRAGRRWRVPP